MRGEPLHEPVARIKRERKLPDPSRFARREMIDKWKISNKGF